MPRAEPVSPRDRNRYLRLLSFDVPFSGGKHEFMVRGTTRFPIPNPHGADISLPLLRRVLDEAGVTREKWEAL